jgi:hypothetical protein
MFVRSGVRPLVLAALVALAALACSSSGRRDQNYGKDAGTTYQPPEGGIAGPDAARARTDGGTRNQDATAEAGGDATIDAESDTDR